MAEMIPDRLPASSTAGERRIFATLGRLPDDCLIYYEPVVRRRYPDLIVILPDVGVLVIEVKDWRLADLASVRSAPAPTVAASLAVLVPRVPSFGVETVAVSSSGPASDGPACTASVNGDEADDASGPAFTQVTVGAVAAHDQPAPLTLSYANPGGRVSTTVMVPVVGPEPPFVTVKV